MKRENFPHLCNSEEGARTKTGNSPGSSVEGRTQISTEHDIESGGAEQGDKKDESKAAVDTNKSPKSTAVSQSTSEAVDEDTTFVELPAPGFSSLSANAIQDPARMRLVPNICSICLCNYEIGSDVVWSSNSNCEHAFHTACIEQWLMKQREGPLCPCCRRDFILDPFDLEDEAGAGTSLTVDDHSEGEDPPAPLTSPMQDAG